jgi:hypothetical protein
MPQSLHSNLWICPLMIISLLPIGNALNSRIVDPFLITFLLPLYLPPFLGQSLSLVKVIVFHFKYISINQ